MFISHYIYIERQKEEEKKRLAEEKRLKMEEEARLQSNINKYLKCNCYV